MKHIYAVGLALAFLLYALTGIAEDSSVLTQEQHDRVDTWFAQAGESIPENDEGQTISGDQFIVAMKEPGTGVYTSLPGDGLELDMAGFPQEHLASSYEEADTLIMIYPVYKVTGQYLGMAIPVSARKTYTTVCAVNLMNGTVESPFCAVVRDAPRSVQIETRNGIPTKNAISGSFEPQKALEKIAERLVISEMETAESASVSELPAELAGEWSGTGIPKNGGASIDLAVTIREDGTGSYTFIQGDYNENYPFSVSAADNTFAVSIPETAQLGKVEGTWTLEDGLLLLDITTTFPNGRIFSYMAACSRKNDPAEDVSMLTADEENAAALVQDMSSLYSSIEREEIPSCRKGGLVIHGKMIVGIRYDESSAFEVLTKGNNTTSDGLAFPDEWLAASYEEADTAVFIYPSYGQMGFYTGGGTGYKTYTMVKHVDLKTMRAYHETVCTQEPPRAVIGNAGSDRYGRFMPDTAIQCIVERAESLVSLGHYADEPIYWRMLDETETTVTLITDKGLDCVCFNETRRDENLWDTSSIRGWLNGEFVNTAFSAEELAQIEPDASGDLVRMLTEDEARAFFAEKEDRTLLPSAAALAHDAYIDKYDGTCGWWLTTQGEQNDKVMYVQWSGAIGSWYVWVNDVAVRPVITLKKNDQ